MVGQRFGNQTHTSTQSQRRSQKGSFEQSASQFRALFHQFSFLCPEVHIFSNQLMSFGHVPLWLYLPDYKMDLIIENICKQYFKYSSNQFSGPKMRFYFAKKSDYLVCWYPNHREWRKEVRGYSCIGVTMTLWASHAYKITPNPEKDEELFCFSNSTFFFIIIKNI